MNEQELLEDALNSDVGALVGEYAWVFVIAFVAILFKSTIENFVAGMLVFNDDDIVYLDGKPARIIRTSMWATTFYLYDIQETEDPKKKIIIGGTKVVIDNTKLKDMLIEKPLLKIEL